MPYRAILNARLTNNDWDTDFKADQAGELRFTLAFHAAEVLEDSAARARPLIDRLEIHLFDTGPSRSPLPDHLISLDLRGVRLTPISSAANDDRIVLQVFNPTAEARRVSVGAGHVVPTDLVRCSLADTWRIPPNPAQTASQ